MQVRTIFFNEAEHSYTDEYSNPYVSTTTYLSNYYYKFEDDAEDIANACEAIGRNPAHPKYLRYKGKSAAEIKASWKKASIDGCERGNKKHNYLQQQVESVNGYNRINGFITDEIYTIASILQDHSYGLIDPDLLLTLKLKQQYPSIYSLIEGFVALGYRLYAEIGVYHTDYLISGLIDLLAVRDGRFVIIDWKTNKAPITYESGYYDKDDNGNLLLDQFIKTDRYFYFPADHLPDSQGHKYSAQLSTYAAITEAFGLGYDGSILCHIRDTENGEIVEIDAMLDLRKECLDMMSHFYNKRSLTFQKKLFN